MCNKMDQEKEPKIPKPFEPHPNLGDRLNEAIIDSELRGGLDLEKLSIDAKIEIWLEDGGRLILEKNKDGYYISGDPLSCPKPTRVVWIGSVWGGSTSIKSNFVGRGMNLQFRLPWQKNEPVEGTTDKIAQPFFITKSIIEDVRELSGSKDEDVLEEYEKEVAEGVEEIKKEKE